MEAVPEADATLEGEALPDTDLLPVILMLEEGEGGGVTLHTGECEEVKEVDGVTELLPLALMLEVRERDCERLGVTEVEEDKLAETEMLDVTERDPEPEGVHALGAGELLGWMGKEKGEGEAEGEGPLFWKQATRKASNAI